MHMAAQQNPRTLAIAIQKAQKQVTQKIYAKKRHDLGMSVHLTSVKSTETCKCDIPHPTHTSH